MADFRLSRFCFSNNDVNPDDIEPILEHMKKKLQSISDDRNNLARARQKALSIYSSFDKAIKRPEIQNVLQTMIKKVESRKRLYRETMNIRGNSGFANYLSVDQYAELLSVKPKRDANIPISWRRIIEDYYTDSINDKEKSIDDWVSVTNDLIVISEKDTDKTAQIKKYLYKVMSPLALDDFIGLGWRVMEAPVHASKYRKNHGLDHITQSVVDGKLADILAWTESGEEIFRAERLLKRADFTRNGDW
ncbi:12982_t:CDS:2 [Funneliformis mosseae]|uniref:12982_t:CDS:1 n=1 Tax=Funneliformis mosseae TaxID=27381 RepID=A0A9N9NAI8_FUNMO|nr:12982_t:CDS:2 [Funneliformis mosseae]